jgi:spermidine/putrescine transport system permease protein
MALIAIMLLVLMAQALVADRASGRAAQAADSADG